MYRKVITTRYSALKGVDFSTSPSLVDRDRSPDSVNMMPDEGRVPVKRPGWQTEYTLEGRVNNLWFCSFDGHKHLLCHCGDRIYAIVGDEVTVIKEDVSDKTGQGFYAQSGDKGYFYILTGREFLRYDGREIVSVRDKGYVPLTSIAKLPSGGGESYEDINLLTPKRRESFTGTEKDLIYQLGSDSLDSVDEVKIMQTDGSYITLDKDTDYTADTVVGKVTFTKAYPTPLTGHDNIVVTYSKTVEGYSDKIEQCTVAAKFGLGGENKIFLSGNPSYPNRDWYSGVYNPEYFPDLNYAIIGNSSTAVMGYLKLGDCMGIVKQSNGQDISLFLRTVSMGEKGAQFAVKGGISSIGAVSKSCFALLGDAPLFLSERGIYAVTSSIVDDEKVIKSRSGKIDPKLTAENCLENAVGCVWKDFYILSVNGHCYLVDGRRKGQSGDYEAYYWENVPATAITADGESLWFGTADGRICRFKDKAEGKLCYSDDGRAITARWATPVEDEGCPERFKTLERKGCLVVLKPFEASGCKVYYKTDGEKKELVRSIITDISTFFGIVDFSRLTFNTNPNPRECYFNKRKKRYKRIQLIFENDSVNEGFGVQGIVKSYRVVQPSEERR